MARIGQVTGRSTYLIGNEFLVVRRLRGRLYYSQNGRGMPVEVDSILREDRVPMTLEVSGALNPEYAQHLIRYEVTRLWGRRLNSPSPVERQTAQAE